MSTFRHFITATLWTAAVLFILASDTACATEPTAEEGRKPVAPIPERVPERAGQPPDNPELTPEQARALYEQHKRHLRRIEGEQEDAKQDVKSIAAERERLKRKLIKTAQEIRASETKMSELENEMARLRAKETNLRESLSQRHDDIARLLAIMQRMGRQPPPAIITQREDALKMVRSGMLLNSFFPALKRKADKLSDDLSKLMTVITELEAKSRQLTEERKSLAKLRLEIRDLIDERQKQLDREKHRLAALQKAAQRHAQAIDSLSGLMKKLEEEVAKVSGLGAYEEELKSDKIVELKPLAKKAAFVEPGRLKPAIPFSQAKGLLFMPVSGTKFKDFGEENEFGGISQGISIRTRAQAQVVSPCDGWVVYAGRFRSYGQLLIISAGGGYHVLLAGMEDINVNPGQFVLAGEPVATMGREGGEAAAQDSSSQAILYVEFRKNERPIDPNPWWAMGLSKG